MTQLSVENLSVEIEGKRLVDAVLFDLRPGEFVGLVGPNGSGKSSLLRAICRVLRPAAGRVVHLGDDVWTLSARDAARRTAVVAQERMGEFDFTVRELVQMGRTPHKGLLDGDSAADREIVEQCLSEVGMSHCATRSFLSLSGGEKQRVLVARALAQQAPLLVLDEPTNHLDIRHQLELLELIKRLKTTTLAALHDLTSRGAILRPVDHAVGRPCGGAGNAAGGAEQRAHRRDLWRDRRGHDQRRHTEHRLPAALTRSGLGGPPALS